MIGLSCCCYSHFKAYDDNSSGCVNKRCVSWILTDYLLLIIFHNHDKFERSSWIWKKHQKQKLKFHEHSSIPIERCKLWKTLLCNVLHLITCGLKCIFIFLILFKFRPSSVYRCLTQIASSSLSPPAYLTTVGVEVAKIKTWKGCR